MNPESAQALIDNVKRANAKGNAHLFSGLSPAMQAVVKSEPSLTKSSAPKRIRQSAKPLMNKLETEFLAWLKRYYPNRRFHVQAIKLRLANGLTYCPDFVCLQFFDGSEIATQAWEVKGPWATDDSIVKLKTAASVFPDINFWLAWKDKSGQWQTQEVLT